ncbi:hypothetical protein ACFX16_008369 [Malus domestica]
MKRVWKLSDAAQSELLSRHRSSSAAVAAASKTPQHSPYTFTRTNYPNYRRTQDVNAQTHSSSAHLLLKHHRLVQRQALDARSQGQGGSGPHGVQGEGRTGSECWGF